MGHIRAAWRPMLSGRRTVLRSPGRERSPPRYGFVQVATATRLGLEPDNGNDLLARKMDFGQVHGSKAMLEDSGELWLIPELALCALRNANHKAVQRGAILVRHARKRRLISSIRGPQRVDPGQPFAGIRRHLNNALASTGEPHT